MLRLSMFLPFNQLRGMRVHVGNVEVGEVSDLILDPAGDTVLGFEVRADGRVYFLPLALAMIPNGSMAVASPLHMVDDVDYYRRRGRAVVWPDAGQLHLELAGGSIHRSPPISAEQA